MLDQNQILSSLKTYKDKHIKEYGIEEIGIFGSYARNEEKADSDIDVFVKLKHSNLFLLSRIRIELEELFGVHTDIVQLRDKMNTYLKKHIEEEAISA
ncbi:MAG: nucleotidyltransferase [Sulfurovum sp.]|nr:MAG: nucleotidyltransferase [Sulfurovum sp.]